MPNAEALLAAIAHARAERHAEAATVLHALLEAEPDDPTALFLLGECALATARPAEAVGLLSRALALRPQHRDGRLALARAQLAAGDPADALATLEPLAADTRLAPAQSLRGTALNALGRPAEAIAAFTHALATAPANAEALLNCGNAHAELDQAEPAEHHIRRAIACDPAMAEAHVSLGHLLAGLGRLPEAIAANAEAIRLQPDFAAAHWNQGVAAMLSGDWSAGWREYEWRKRRFPASFATQPGPQWPGLKESGLRKSGLRESGLPANAALDGQTILVLAEQGFGDAIQFARYLPLLAQRGARVVLQCAAPMIPLLGAMPGIHAVPRGVRVPYDCWVDQMSLPLLFGTTVETVPTPSAYLSPDPARAAKWHQRLPAGLRVGIVWAGNPLHSNDRRRSMPAAALAPIVAAGRNALVSLQVGPCARDLSRLFGLADYAGRLTDWAETAAAISVMDLVITVDTAVAHLAGALGIPVWLMLPAAPDWRWMLHRDDSPWYSGMRLFRQQSPGDWAGVAARIAAELTALIGPDQSTAAYTIAPSYSPAYRIAPPYDAAPAYSMAIPPLTCSVAPVTQPASAEAR